MVVYWIRLKEHTDISKEGYVGVAIDFKNRMYRHKKITSNIDCHLSNAIKKYGWDNLIKEIIFEGSKEDCYKKEKELRSAFHIGWNEAIGGMGGDRSAFIDYKNRIVHGWIYDKSGERNPFFNKSHSKESLRKISKNKCSAIITTPDGIFYGFNELARFYKVHKLTAKKMLLKNKEWVCEYK